jgi:pimeloyl-ACP methyl ester carboxylesterase
MTSPIAASSLPRPIYRTIEADGVEMFYREAGPADAPVLLLLHGFPTSSHMFRELIPRLATKYRVIAPDLPGFGFTVVPEARSYTYTFANLAQTIESFVNAIGLKKFALYVFDYGAPVGLRLALKDPLRITGIVSQNGNAYLEGLGDAWDPIRTYWKEPTEGHRDALRGFLTLDATRWQYTNEVPKAHEIAPEGYTLDALLMARPGNAEIQLDLFLDYNSNLALYPKFQEYFRAAQPPLLAIWGKHDPFFLPAGAEAYRKDNPKARVELLDAGHFALETHVNEITVAIDNWMKKEVC